MRKIFISILPIIYATCALGAKEQNSKWFNCNNEPEPDTYCQKTATYPDHATKRVCNKNLNRCVARACDEANGYTLALNANGNSNGYCVKDSVSTPTQTQPTPQPAQDNISIHICGLTVFQDKNEQNTTVDYIIDGVSITGIDIASCTSGSDSAFDCGTVNSATGTLTFTKNGFLPKTLNVSRFQNLTCPRVVMEKDPNATAPVSTNAGTGLTAEQAHIDALTTMCRKSLGDELDDDNNCVCDANKFLETTTVKDTKNNDITICRCIKGYKRENDNYTDKCIPAGDVTESQELDAEASQAAQALQDYESVRKNEQSWANKGLTAGTTLATGEGAMAATQAYFEQRADADAERDMAAYLATFKCEYGGGKTFNAGNEEIFLPGGNELLNYYSEYKTLADSVKQTKTALGLRSGIESEVLYDRAQSGLYQYTTAEQKSGGEMSLSRALSNPTGVDAEKWNAQKAQTAQNLQTGLYTVGGGIVASILGNYLINTNHEREEVAQIFKPVTVGEDQYHDQDFTPIETAETELEQPTPQQAPEMAQKPEIFAKPYPSDKWFKSGSYDITPEGQADLDTQVVNNIIDALKVSPNTKFYISVIGHTDGVPVTKKSGRAFKNNRELSQLRAQSVSNYLQRQLQQFTSSITYAETVGKGDEECATRAQKKDDPSCRKVVITITDTTPYRDYID